MFSIPIHPPLASAFTELDSKNMMGRTLRSALGFMFWRFVYLIRSVNIDARKAISVESLLSAFLCLPEVALVD